MEAIMFSWISTHKTKCYSFDITPNPCISSLKCCSFLIPADYLPIPNSNFGNNWISTFRYSLFEILLLKSVFFGNPITLETKSWKNMCFSFSPDILHLKASCWVCSSWKCLKKICKTRVIQGHMVEQNGQCIKQLGMWHVRWNHPDCIDYHIKGQ